MNAYNRNSLWQYDDAPFAPLSEPHSETKIGLLTTSGHFVDSDDPELFGVKDMSQEEALMRISEFLKAKPSLSTIPIDIPRKHLLVRYGGYDKRAAQDDYNVVLPIDRIGDLEVDGLIGQLLERAYSFVGLALRNPC